MVIPTQHRPVAGLPLRPVGRPVSVDESLIYATKHNLAAVFEVRVVRRAGEHPAHPFPCVFSLTRARHHRSLRLVIASYRIWFYIMHYRHFLVFFARSILPKQQPLARN